MEVRKLRVRGAESEGFKRLHVASDILGEAITTFHDRSGLIQYGRRDLALASKLVDRVFVRMLETVPQEQGPTLIHNSDNATYSIGVRRYDRIRNDKDFGTWISWETLGILLDSVKEKCLLCDLNPQEQRQCPVAKALDTLAVDKSTEDIGCGRWGRR